MVQDIKKKITEWREFLLLFLAILNIVGVALAAYITIRLSPLEKNIAVLATEVQANADTDTKEHASYVKIDTFNGLVNRIDHISNRVDQIYSIITR